MGSMIHTIGGTDNLVKFKTAARVPIKSLKIRFNPVQNLNGYDKPWPGGSRKNIFNYKIADIADDMCRDYNGTEKELKTRAYTRGFTKVKPSTVYTATLPRYSTNSWCIYYLDSEGVWIKSSSEFYRISSFTFTTPNTCYNIQIQGITGENWERLQIEEGSSSTSFEPYGNECPVESRTKIDLYIDKNQLPQEYQPVEYLQSTGVDGINTGLLYHAGDTISVDFKPGSKIGSIFGAIYKVDDNSIYRCTLETNQNYVYLNSTSPHFTNVYSGNNINNVTRRNGIWYINDVSYYGGSDYSVEKAEILLFASYTRDLKGRPAYSTSSYSRASIYRYTHIHNGEVHTFIPCYRKSDNQTGMYDTFNKVFHYGDGFNCGPNISTVTTIPVAFSSPIINGYVDVITGDVVEEWHHETKHITGDIGVPGGTGTYSEDYRYIAFNLPSKYLVDTSKRDQALCNLAPYSQQTTEPIRFWLGTGTVYLYLPADGKEYDVDIWYPCQTHETYHIEPMSLKTNFGLNRIWSDTNDITEVSYAIHDSAMIQAAKKRMAAFNSVKMKEYLKQQNNG